MAHQRFLQAQVAPSLGSNSISHGNAASSGAASRSTTRSLPRSRATPRLALYMPYTFPVNNAPKSCRPTSRTGCSREARTGRYRGRQHRRLQKVPPAQYLFHVKFQGASRLPACGSVYHPHHIFTCSRSSADLEFYVAVHSDSCGWPPQTKPNK